MTRPTSSRSAKATPKMAPEPGTNGTPHTAPNSGSTSLDSELEAGVTEWNLISNHKRYRVKVLGKNGRISWGGPQHRDGAEVRFYRTASSKHYDAVMPNVTTIWSTNVIIDELGPTKESAEEAERYKKAQQENFDKVIEAVLSRKELPEEEEAW